MSLNLAQTKLSFEDRLNQFNDLYNQPDIDPEKIAEGRLETIRCAKKCLEDKSSPEAVRWYGWSLVIGDEGFPVNIEEGIRYLNEAVMMRSLNAFVNLGDIYSGEVPNIPEEMIDFEKAVKNYERASETNDGYASYRLAEIYSGNGLLERNLRLALDYVEKSESQGSEEGTCLMARWIYIGEYMQQDFEKAYHMFYEIVDAAEFGNDQPKTATQINSLFIVGLMLFNGEYIGQDEEKGFNMIQEAAQYGDGEAIDWMEAYQAQ